MTKDIPGIVGKVCGYNKIPDEDGDQLIEVKYKLRDIDLLKLQILFNIDPQDPDPVVRYMIDCYDINEAQAKILQPYVIDGVIDLEKYDFMLQCYSEK